MKPVINKIRAFSPKAHWREVLAVIMVLLAYVFFRTQRKKLSTNVPHFEGRRNQAWIFTGYSFGADVIPFVINRLSPEIKSKLAKVLMISPSTSTDFEIHFSDMFGNSAKRSMDMVAEVNKMQIPELVTVFGCEEKEFPVTEIIQKNHASIDLPGSHYYDGDASGHATTLTNSFR